MRVLISGAGIAGSTLAWYLAKAGANVTVVERTKAILPIGQNIDIEGSAQTVIKRMGAESEVRRFNTTEKGTKFIDANGEVYARLPLKPGLSVSPTSEFEILRGDLAAVLYEASNGLPKVEYLFDTTIKEVISNDAKEVKVELSSGKIETYDVLIAADGQWSRTRRQCFPAESVSVRDMRAFVVYCTVPRLPSDDDWWGIYHALGSRVLSIRPDPHGTVRASFTRMPRDDAHKKEWLDASKSDKRTQVEFLKKEFADAGWYSERFLAAVDQAPDFYFHALQQIRMSSWSTDRVVCVGDAGYCPTPLTGMGTSLALMGAYVLAGELSMLKDGEHPSKAFDAYESKFRPFVEQTQNVPFFIPDVAHPGPAWKRWLLQTVISTLSRVTAVVVAIPWLAGKFVASHDERFPLPHYPIFMNEASG